MEHSCESGQGEFFWLAIPESDPPEEVEVNIYRGLTGWVRFVGDMDTLGFAVECNPMMQMERIRWADGSVTVFQIVQKRR